MSHEVPWNKYIVEEFVELALLTDDEEKILRTRVAGWSRVKQAEAFGMSVSTVDKHIRTLKDKYDSVQKYSPLLPPRKTAIREGVVLDEPDV